MKETCENCKYFSGLLKSDDGCFHKHNYCSLWNRFMEIPPKSIITEFLEEFEVDTWKMLESKKSQQNPIVFDDIESGIATCYAFKESLTKEDNDVIMESRFEWNKQLALDTIQFIITTKKIYSHAAKSFLDLSKEDEEYIINMREKIEKINF